MIGGSASTTVCRPLHLQRGAHGGKVALLGAIGETVSLEMCGNCYCMAEVPQNSPFNYRPPLVTKEWLMS
jgi:hypothetical protein